MSQRKPIYIDMDNVLIAPVFDPITGDPVDLIIRPGVREFLEKMNRYGDLTLLTAASSRWADYVLKRLGSIPRIFKQIVTGDDLYVIAQQRDVVEKAIGLSDEDREALYREIQPILPPGVIFDDFPVGSGMYFLKGLATGITLLNPHLWIQVEEFSVESPDRGGLERAYQEFRKRNAAWRAQPELGRKKIFEGSLR